MITPESAMTRVGNQYITAETYYGLSTDTPKPTSGIGNGSRFIEMDSSKIYFFDAANSQWKEWGASS